MEAYKLGIHVHVAVDIKNILFKGPSNDHWWIQSDQKFLRMSCLTSTYVKHFPALTVIIEIQ